MIVHAWQRYVKMFCFWYQFCSGISLFLLFTMDNKHWYIFMPAWAHCSCSGFIADLSRGTVCRTPMITHLLNVLCPLTPRYRSLSPFCMHCWTVTRKTLY